MEHILSYLNYIDKMIDELFTENHIKDIFHVKVNNLKKIHQNRIEKGDPISNEMVDNVNYLALMIDQEYRDNRLHKIYRLKKYSYPK